MEKREKNIVLCYIYLSGVCKKGVTSVTGADKALQYIDKSCYTSRKV